MPEGLVLWGRGQKAEALRACVLSAFAPGWPREESLVAAHRSFC